MEQLKALAGSWTGMATWDQGGKKGSVEFALDYRVTSGGEAVVETMFPGAPGEMVTVHYLEGGEMTATHYCSAGNQPRMKLVPQADPSVLDFRCVGGLGMRESDSHMHSAQLTIVDSGQVRGVWTNLKDGKPTWEARAELTRKK
jgi:hypothetical protein